MGCYIHAGIPSNEGSGFRGWGVTFMPGSQARRGQDPGDGVLVLHSCRDPKQGGVRVQGMGCYIHAGIPSKAATTSQLRCVWMRRVRNCLADFWKPKDQSVMEALFRPSGEPTIYRLNPMTPICTVCRRISSP